MSQLLEDWFPQVMVCLALQAAIVGGARVLEHLTPPSPLCSAPHLAL